MDSSENFRLFPRTLLLGFPALTAAYSSKVAADTGIFQEFQKPADFSEVKNLQIFTENCRFPVGTPATVSVDSVQSVCHSYRSADFKRYDSKLPPASLVRVHSVGTTARKEAGVTTENLQKTADF